MTQTQGMKMSGKGPNMGIVKRIPMILLVLVLIFFAWVMSPFLTNHLPVSIQKPLAGSTNLATKLYDMISRKAIKSTFKPGHYTGLPKSASFIANFSIDMNVDNNLIAHPILKLNGNVLTPPENDSKDQFLIEYPGQSLPHPTLVSEATWMAYFKAHPDMFVQVSQATANMDVWVMADKQWWSKKYPAGKVNLNNYTFTSGPAPSTPDSVGSKLSGDQGGFQVPLY